MPTEPRVLAISPRISHASEVSERIGLELYLNHRGNYWSIENMKVLPGFMTTVESLHYLEGAEPYDAIIVDEAEATIEPDSSAIPSNMLRDVGTSSARFYGNARIGLHGGRMFVKNTIETISNIVGQEKEKVLRINQFQPYPSQVQYCQN
jgi:hypothetical protein